MQEQEAHYVPVAVYYDLADSVEYVRADTPCHYHRVDDFLTLVFDLENDALIGFRLKGFKNFYLRRLKPVCDSLGMDFVSLQTVIVSLIAAAGDEYFKDQERQSAYRQANELVQEDDVRLYDLPKAA